MTTHELFRWLFRCLTPRDRAIARDALERAEKDSEEFVKRVIEATKKTDGRN